MESAFNYMFIGFNVEYYRRYLELRDEKDRVKSLEPSYKKF